MEHTSATLPSTTTAPLVPQESSDSDCLQCGARKARLPGLVICEKCQEATYACLKGLAPKMPGAPPEVWAPKMVQDTAVLVHERTGDFGQAYGGIHLRRVGNLDDATRFRGMDEARKAASLAGSAPPPMPSVAELVASEVA